MPQFMNPLIHFRLGFGKRKVGKEIDVFIMGKYHGVGIIVEDYDDKQWIVAFEMTYPNGYKTKVRRYIDK